MSTSLAVMRTSLKENEKQIIAKLGGMIGWEYFCSAFLTMFNKNTALRDCTPVSLIAALLDAAQLRLIPDGVLGEAYLVPYGGKATLIPGYKGLIQLCLRSGLVKKIGAKLVYENDFFEYEFGLDEKCKLIPTEKEPGKIRGAFYLFEMSDGVRGFDFWSYTKLMDHKNKFAKGLSKKDHKGNFTSPWVLHEESMIFKTMIRVATNVLPKSIESLQMLNKREDRIDLGLGLDDGTIDITPEESGKKLDADKDNLDNLHKENPKDDIPIDSGRSDVTISVDQETAFCDRVSERGIKTMVVIKFLKKNGFSDPSKITTEDYELIMEGLNHI